MLVHHAVVLQSFYWSVEPYLGEASMEHQLELSGAIREHTAPAAAACVVCSTYNSQQNSGVCN